ncbi:hypothetical protein CDEF62S_04990 [Castellaniella defragrans]
METITKQDRITLKNLKVADFASEETLCFTATIVFDGIPIAEARNDGHGGSTLPPRAQRQGGAAGAGRSLRQGPAACAARPGPRG